ncbi:MAG: hypothetical protein WC829_17595 [Hyphomicrobium sp.]|jgi:hypothetical protein
MKKIGTIAAVAVALIVGAFAGYWLMYPTYSHRYRLTLEVETPDGLKKGSSVMESRVRAEPHVLPNVGAVTSFDGDAVFVDLGGGKNLIGLLAVGMVQGSEGLVRAAIKTFDIPTDCGKPFCQWKLIAETNGARDLPPELTPLLATMGNVRDPKSTRVVKPDEFGAVFGPGYRLKRAWIEMTSDPVTRGIQERLPWLAGFKGLTGGGSNFHPGNPGQNLTANHFVR